MVRKSVRCGQRTGNTIRKHFMLFVSNHGYVNYNFINTPGNFESEKYQRLFSRKDFVFQDGRKSHLEILEDDGAKLDDVHLDRQHREGNEVCYSLDKHQRWTLPSVIKENIESFAEEDFRVVLSERKTVTMFLYKGWRYPYVLIDRFRTWNDCVQYVDSKAPVTKATPKKSASFFCDLRQKCSGGGHIEKKTGERRRKRHNLHCRGVQRKSELHQKAEKVDRTQGFTHYDLLDGADGGGMAEFRYEVCDPSGMKSRTLCNLSKWWEDDDIGRLGGQGIRCHGRKSLLKQKGFVNGVRVAWKKYQLRNWSEDFTEHVPKSRTTLSSASSTQETELFHQSEKAVYMYDSENDDTCCVVKKETLELDIFDCLMKAKQSRKLEKKLGRGIKRKLSEPDLDFKSHIIYLNESKTEEVDQSNTKSDIPEDLPKAEVDVPSPCSAKCFFKKDDVDEFFRKTPVFCSTSSYPAIFVIPLLMSEKENVDNIAIDLKHLDDGAVSSLLLQETLSSVVSSAAGVMECRLRLIGNEELYAIEEATMELSRFIRTREEFLILTLGDIYQCAKDLMRQRFSHVSTDKPRKHQQELELEPVFDWLPTVTYNVTTVKQASLLIGGTQDSGEVGKLQLTLPTSPEYSPECEYDCAVCFASLLDDGKDSVEGVLICPCQHSFCRTCLFQYAMEKIRTGARCITCLEYKCESEIDPVTILSLVPVRSFGQWSYRQQEQVVMSTGLWKWCPNKTCDLILSLVCRDLEVERRERVPRALLRDRNLRHVMCHCNTEFCMECQEFPHWPASCQQFGEYTKALNIQKDLLKEDDYVRSFRVNVKPCPRCKEKVDKNGGCNAMMCRCGHHFCWLCLQPNPYGVHKCREVPLQEVELVNTKAVKFQIKFLEMAYSCRVWCSKLTEWKITLVKKIQELEGSVKSFAGVHVDCGRLQNRLSSLCLQLQYLNAIIESLKLMENVFISISNLRQRSPIAKEINSLFKTVDFIISRTVEMLQGFPNDEIYSRIDLLQTFLSQKVKKMVLLSLYTKHVTSKRIQCGNQRTIHGQTLKCWVAYE